jgi:hypothetical protein
VLQCGEATQVGKAAACDTLAPPQVELLLCGEATQVGDAIMVEHTEHSNCRLSSQELDVLNGRPQHVFMLP